MVNWGDERLPERFWDKVSPCPMSGCWHWTGPRTNGQCATPVIRVNGSTTTVRQLVWRTVRSDCAARISSKCGDSVCVNPDHLVEDGEDEIGKRYERLTVVSRSKRQSRHGVLWVCKCDCGNLKVVPGPALRTGHYQSCGCLRTDQLKTHGLRRTRAYSIWHNMIRRCTNPKNIAYPRYGGRGIGVDERWLVKGEGFINFIQDMGHPPNGFSLDRIDVNGNYEKANCRWSDSKVQANNRRASTARVTELTAQAVSRIQSSDKASYSKSEVLSILRVLRFNLVGE